MEPNNMIRMVAFDSDGTIADTIHMYVQAFKKVVSPYTGNEILKTFGLNEIGMVKQISA